jgi:hypothetical protein
MMKKLTAGLALAGFFAAMIGTSYAGPAAQPVSDSLATYTGEATDAGLVEASYVVHVEYSDYVLHLEWSRMEANAAATGAETDALFDK